MYADATVEELRCDVRSIRPHDRMELRVELDEAEEGLVAQRFEDRSIQLSREVHLSLDTIT